MGSGIAISLANAGIGVTLLDVNDAALARARGIIESSYASSVRKHRLTRDAEIAIEAVFEEMDLKQSVFRKLDGAIREQAAFLPSGERHEAPGDRARRRSPNPRSRETLRRTRRWYAYPIPVPHHDDRSNGGPASGKELGGREVSGALR